MPPAPGAGMARTTAPFSMLRANRPKAPPRNCSVTSRMRSGLRRSGLSEPNSSIACSKGMRGKGAGVTARFVPLQSANSSKTPASTGSMAAKTSSCVTKLISKSSW